MAVIMFELARVASSCG